MKRKKKNKLLPGLMPLYSCIPECSSQFYYPSSQTHFVLYTNIYMVFGSPPRAAAGDNAEPELESTAFNWMSVHITLVE